MRSQQELAIYDDPGASYDDNHNLSFNDAYLEVFDRQMDSLDSFDGEPMYDEDTERLCRIDKFPINPRSMVDIDNLIGLLQ